MREQRDSDKRITTSQEPLGWMGNMCGYWNEKPLLIEFDDITWKCTESLFQALRFCNDPEAMEFIHKAKNGFQAKIRKNQLLKEGHTMSIVPCSILDLRNMNLVIYLKLSQHPELIDELLSTNGFIYEDVSSRRGGNNLFWGAAKVANYWVGINMLGNIYMLYRKLIHEGKNLYDVYLDVQSLLSNDTEVAENLVTSN